MSVRKLLIKLSNRLESGWNKANFSESPIQLSGGWYVTEFVLQGALDYIPRLILEDKAGVVEPVQRDLVGAHAGRNRMLIYLPTGELTAISEGLEFKLLARVPWWEARFRIVLICLRYLADFLNPITLIKVLVLQFKSPIALSDQLLKFYEPAGAASSYQNIDAWQKYVKFAPLFAWWYRSIRLAVVIENDSQRETLTEQMVAADAVLLQSEVKQSATDFDYILPLGATENLVAPAILMIKRAIRRATKLNKQSPRLLYSDHDYSYDEQAGDAPLAPIFKPSPSAVYLHCFNYIGPSVVYATELLDDQGFSNIFDTDCQYRLAIKAFTNPGRVVHIDELLFSSKQLRALSTPPPLSQTSPWTDIEWQRSGDSNVLRASDAWQSYPSVQLIIPTRDGLDVLKPCVDSLLEKTDYPNFQISIVDNGSEKPETHQYLTEISRHERVSIIDYPGEFNYSAINNFAAGQSDSDYIAMINNDIEVIHADWLRQMMAWAKQPEVGVVGAKLLFGNGKVQHAGVTIGMGNAAGHIHRLEAGDSPGYQNRCIATQNMMAVTAACLITPRSLFDKLGGLDEEYLKVAYNDIDYCLRVDATGKQIIWTPEATLYHHESVSRGDDMSNQHIERYFYELGILQKRWKTKGFVDKYYNKHLRIGDEGVYPQIETAAASPLRYL